jgi:methyltransferase
LVTEVNIAVLLFCVVTGSLIAERLIELRIARRNTSELLSRGAKEFGADHFYLFFLLHTAFFLSLLLEFVLRKEPLAFAWQSLLIGFVLTEALRLWMMQSLGRRWTAKVIVVPNEALVVTGPYRFIPHPNYLVVVLEFVIVPLIFDLYWTAAIFSVLNLVLLLGVRIPIERRALRWSQFPE